MVFLEIKLKEMNYQNIKEAPESYESGNIISRFIDALAFRYYWSTEGLTEKDLAYKPSETGMSTQETLEHMVWLTIMIKNALTRGVSDRAINLELKGMDFNSLRNQSLENLEFASDKARGYSSADLEKLTVVIRNKDKDFTAPLWNMMNGPLSDALYHTGQIVSFRRSSGNPLPKGVNHFLGRGAY